MTLDWANDELGAPFWFRRSSDGIISVGRYTTVGFLSTDVVDNDLVGARDRLNLEKLRRVNAETGGKIMFWNRCGCDGPSWSSMESAPKDGTDVLLLLSGDRKRKIVIGRFTDTTHVTNGKETYRNASWSIGLMLGEEPEPIGWMHLPPENFA